MGKTLVDNKNKQIRVKQIEIWSGSQIRLHAGTVEKKLLLILNKEVDSWFLGKKISSKSH